MHFQKQPCNFEFVRRGGLNLGLTTTFTIMRAIEKHTQLSFHEKEAPHTRTLLIKKLEWKMSSLYLFFPPMNNKHLKPTVIIMKSAFHVYLTGEGFVILSDDLLTQ